MTLQEAANELKAMKAHIESGFSVVGHDAYYMAIRSLEAWDRYAEDLDAVYEDESKNRFLIREWIEKGGSE